jgi:transposase
MQATPTNSTHAGIDWSWQHHALCIVDDTGQRIEEATLKHSRSGLAKITALLRRHAVVRVGIERGDGPVVEHLIRDGFEVVVISARQVKSLRARYGSAGNKDDRFDAFVLADALRTDAGRWRSCDPTARKRSRCECWSARGTTSSITGSPCTTALLAHPDGPIFQSLPRSGTVRAATLLAEIGDCRARFPDPASLAAAAGVTPSTRQSGKHLKRHLPARLQQTTPSGPGRLGPRHPTRQPLGPRHLRPSPRPRLSPPPRSQDPGQRLDQDPLALLARPSSLRPRATWPAQHPPPSGCLT